jgi:hypothetical protein
MLALMRLHEVKQATHVNLGLPDLTGLGDACLLHGSMEMQHGRTMHESVIQPNLTLTFGWPWGVTVRVMQLHHRPGQKDPARLQPAACQTQVCSRSNDEHQNLWWWSRVGSCREPGWGHLGRTGRMGRTGSRNPLSRGHTALGDAAWVRH